VKPMAAAGEGGIPFRAVIPRFALYDPAAAFQILGTPRMELFKRMDGGGNVGGKKRVARSSAPRFSDGREARRSASAISFRLSPGQRRTQPCHSVHRIGYFRGTVELSAKSDAAELRTFKVCVTVSFIEVIKTCFNWSDFNH